MPDDFQSGLDPRQEAFLDTIEAHLKQFDCSLMADQTDDGCWHVIACRASCGVKVHRGSAGWTSLAEGLPLLRA